MTLTFVSYHKSVSPGYKYQYTFPQKLYTFDSYDLSFFIDLEVRHKFDPLIISSIVYRPLFEEMSSNDCGGKDV